MSDPHGKTDFHLPGEAGTGGADHLPDCPAQAFQHGLEQRLDHLRAELLESGYPAPATTLICQVARKVAQEALRQT